MAPLFNLPRSARAVAARHSTLTAWTVDGFTAEFGGEELRRLVARFDEDDLDRPDGPGTCGPDTPGRTRLTPATDRAYPGLHDAPGLPSSNVHRLLTQPLFAIPRKDLP